MHQNGGYYLHANGKLIYKPHGLEQRDIDESDLVVKYWKNANIGTSPTAFIAFLKEAVQLGAMSSEIARLADHNQLTEYYPIWHSVVFGGTNEN